MADVALLLGAGVYLAQSMFKVDTAGLEERSERPLTQFLEPLREMVIHEGRENGIIAPSYNNVAARVPWTPANPYVYVWQSDSNGPTDRSVERAYQLFANRLEHEREDVSEQIMRGRDYFPRKVGNSLWTAFTDEISLTDQRDGSKYTTNHASLQWLPNNPTDYDYTDAAAMAKQLPPDPLLFTPDSTFMTAPGLPFRHGVGNTV